jgi:apolipoprotein N-acyltransferase
LARSAVRHGANSLASITNDAWFGTSSAPYQHKEMAGWRAIEFRVPLLRSANTGISCIYDARGKTLGSIPLNEQGYLVADVHPIHVKTFYAEWGDLFAWFCVFAALIVISYSELSRPEGEKWSRERGAVHLS